MDWDNRVRTCCKNSLKLLLISLLLILKDEVESSARVFSTNQAGISLGNVRKIRGSTIDATIRPNPYPAKNYLFIYHHGKQILGKNEDDTDVVIAQLTGGEDIASFAINKQLIMVAQIGHRCVHSFHPLEATSKDITPCTSSHLQSIDMIELANEKSTTEFILFSKRSSDLWRLTYRKGSTNVVTRISEFDKDRAGMPNYMTVGPLGKRIFFSTDKGVWLCKATGCSDMKVLINSNSSRDVNDGKYKTTNAKKVEQVMCVNPWLFLVADSEFGSIKTGNLKYHVISSYCQNKESPHVFKSGNRSECAIPHPKRMVMHKKTLSILIFGDERYNLSFTRYSFKPPPEPTKSANRINAGPIAGISLAGCLIVGMGVAVGVLHYMKMLKIINRKKEEPITDTVTKNAPTVQKKARIP